MSITAIPSGDMSPSGAEEAQISPRGFLRDRTVIAGLAILAFVILFVLVGPLAYRVNPDAASYTPLLTPFTRGAPILGTDAVGRDMIAQLMVGGRLTLFVGLLAAVITAVLGVLVGSVAGYFGGWIDALLMRITELVLIVPTLVFALAILTLVPPTSLNVAIVVGALSWTTTARVARAEFLRLRDQEFATAARAIGAGNLYLIYRVILPNALAPLIIMASLSVANAILVVAGLSFLGLVDPNQSSWGLILAFNRGSILTDLWPTTLAGLAIFITVLGVGLVADGLNDALNPRRRGR